MNFEWNQNNLAEESSKTVLQVLCVTKRMKDIRGETSFHLPIVGELELRTRTIRVAEFPITKTVAIFHGREYAINHIRTGLDGSAIVIGIKNNEEYPYTIWELYTDVPSCLDEFPPTLEEINQFAKEAIAHQDRCRQD